MQRQHPQLPWCRYADDGLVHCNSGHQAHSLLKELNHRFQECGLEIHPDKTRIVYCKDGKRTEKHACTAFDFLGYTFKPRLVRNSKDNSFFVGFTPAASKVSVKAMRDKTRHYKWHLRSELSLEEISKRYNPVLRGWLNYYGRFHSSKLNEVWRHFNRTLVKWAMRKYRKLKRHKTRAIQYINRIAEVNPRLFVHWHCFENFGSFV